MSKQIGILGSGVVAQTLGTGFIKHGYTVMLGTRNPDKLTDWKNANPGSEIGTSEETARFGDLIVLAVKGEVAKSVLKKIDTSLLAGKIIIDTTNPIADEPPENGVLKFFTGPNQSLMEELQRTFPEIQFVKAFNSVGNALMVNPTFNITPTMFICGDSPNAKQAVTSILDVFGWEVMDMGESTAARAIEPLCVLWCIPGFRENSWSHAFKLLRQ